VVINASSIPKLSFRTLANGAKQFVVHEAFETIDIDLESYILLLTPITNIGVSLSFGGAEIITFFAPLFKCKLHLSLVKNKPEFSQMYSAPKSPHLTLDGSVS
jgi:hypothetical protein